MTWRRRHFFSDASRDAEGTGNPFIGVSRVDMDEQRAGVGFRRVKALRSQRWARMDSSEQQRQEKGPADAAVTRSCTETIHGPASGGITSWRGSSRGIRHA